MENAKKEYEKDEEACDEASKKKVDEEIGERRQVWVSNVRFAGFRLKA
ncbi:MAG: hypothetical protein V1927_00895 [Candidatus Omnitrophota bacterium]